MQMNILATSWVDIPPKRSTLWRTLLCTVAIHTLLQAQSPTPPAPLKPVEPIAAIIDAFRSHEIVALGNVEGRGNEQSHAFQLSLISHPRFAGPVNDIVVEFGNAQYQGLMDRFVGG